MPQNFRRIIFFSIFIISSFICLQSCGKKVDSNSTVLHSFNGADGATPKGSPALVGNTIYGYTSAGGTNNKGVIFKINNNGSGYQVLYNFQDGANNKLGKESHHDALLYFNNALYGVALNGGDENNGVVFKINTDGSNYSPIHIFKNKDSANGAQPHSGVIAVNNILYGMTAAGGVNDKGVIYKINPDGSEFHVMYSFEKSTGDNPHGRLTLGSDSQTLFGITRSGGADNVGVIFSYSLPDSSYKVMHEFKKSKNNGSTSEHGYLIQKQNKLFGMTLKGGENDKGVIFSIDEKGSDFKILHSFGEGSNDGASPYGSLHLSGDYLYGTTQDGGENGRGTVFRIKSDGKDYKILHSFDRETTGEHPIDNVIINDAGTELYCFPQEGGAFDETGKKQYGGIVKIQLTGEGKK